MRKREMKPISDATETLKRIASKKVIIHKRSTKRDKDKITDEKYSINEPIDQKQSADEYNESITTENLEGGE